MYKTLSILTFFLVTSFGVAQSNKKVEKPNIVFIFADDQTFESIGSFNNNEIKTPNLDRLKNRGVSFNHAYNMGTWSAAVCLASRAMLNTGKYVWTAASYEKKLHLNRGTGPFSIKKSTPKGYWSTYMRDAGYDTYMTGKWHVHVKADSVFDVASHVRKGMPDQSKERYKRKFIEGQQDEWTPYNPSFGGYWEGGKHWSEIVGDDALSFIETAKNDEDPFFMYLAFNAPHDPRQSPKKYVDMYPVENIKVPESFMPEYPYNNKIGSGRGLRDERLAPFPRTEYSVKMNRQEYYAIITHMDEQIGRILDAVEASGKADNTYIIFTADHGLALGDHGFIGKQNLYDASIRVPMFIAGPGIKGGEEINEKVYLQDAMATALDLAGSKDVNNVDFQSLLPIYKGKKKGHHGIYGAYLNYQRMYRTDKYKMIIYPGANVVRLYDVELDPNELEDLAGDYEYKEILDLLFSEFQELQKEMKDPLDVTKHYNAFFENNMK